MSLSNLTIPTALIKVAAGEFSVRGLSLDDMNILVSEHKAEMTALYHKFTGQQNENDDNTEIDDISGAARAVLEEAPALAAKAIAIAADEKEAHENARRLPFPVQLEALDHIGRLTFDSEGGVKKVLEIVIQWAQGANALTAHLPVSQSGSGDSADR